jgi:hypothetical protein
MPLLVFSLFPIMAFVSLAVDVGTWRNELRMQQAAADSAAIAAAQEIGYGDSNAAAIADATTNGFVNSGSGSDGTTGVKVTAAMPTTGYYANDAEAMEVDITAKTTSNFAKFFGIKPTSFVRAVAEMNSNAGATCMYVMGSFNTSATSAHGLYAPSCNIMVNGNWTENTSTVNSPSIGVGGTISLSGTPTFTQASPAPALPVSDPCMNMSACAYLTNNPPSTSGCITTAHNLYQSTTLSPGCYNGIDFSAHGGASITMLPGVYVMSGGDFVSNGGTVNGTGVTIVLTGSAAVTFNGGVENLTAPTSGNTQGMVIYQPASDTSAMTMNGGDPGTCPLSGAPSFSGAVYAPSAAMTVDGTEWSPSTIVAGSISKEGAMVCITKQPTMQWPVLHAVLVE